MAWMKSKQAQNGNKIKQSEVDNNLSNNSSWEDYK